MLKLWQLSKQQIDGYDVIMFYGGQDMNAVMSNIILSQKCAKVSVKSSLLFEIKLIFLSGLIENKRKSKVWSIFI